MELGTVLLPIDVMNLSLVQSIWSLIQTLSLEERSFLRSQLLTSEETTTSKAVDLNQFSAVIMLELDPLEFQRQMRDEWS